MNVKFAAASTDNEDKVIDLIREEDKNIEGFVGG
jgi:hypothetical protein